MRRFAWLVTTLSRSADQSGLQLRARAESTRVTLCILPLNAVFLFLFAGRGREGADRATEHAGYTMRVRAPGHARTYRVEEMQVALHIVYRLDVQHPPEQQHEL